MEIQLGSGSLSQSIGLDTYSLHYFEMDGCTFCGSRYIVMYTQVDWVSTGICEVTIESNDL